MTEYYVTRKVQEAVLGAAPLLPLDAGKLRTKYNSRYTTPFAQLLRHSWFNLYIVGSCHSIVSSLSFGYFVEHQCINKTSHFTYLRASKKLRGAFYGSIKARTRLSQSLLSSQSQSILKMFSRQIVKSSSSLGASLTSLRAFTTSVPLLRSPALADISSSSAPTFEAKRKEFREKLAEQSKPPKKEG